MTSRFCFLIFYSIYVYIEQKIEGDGSFFIRRKNFQLNFAIVQHSRDSELMHKIKEFLYNLADGKQIIQKTSIMINENLDFTAQATSEFSDGDKSNNRNLVTNLVIVNYDLIKLVIVPFFSTLK